MEKFHDKDGKELKNGSVIDIHQTVNGCNLFKIVEENGEMHAEYYCEWTRGRRYEYDFRELIEVDDPYGNIEIELVKQL